jgi:hypothetical protein
MQAPQRRSSESPGPLVFNNALGGDYKFFTNVRSPCNAPQEKPLNEVDKLEIRVHLKEYEMYLPQLEQILSAWTGLLASTQLLCLA